MARRCFVCGFKTDQAICSRCNTILAPGRATCRDCGKTFDGWIAECDACGARIDPTASEPSNEEAIRALTAVPGITEVRARELVAHGFRDFADIVRLALPESAVEHGLHHTIARRAMLADLVARTERVGTEVRCPMCGAAWLKDAFRCAACGSSPDLELDPEVIEDRLHALTGEIVDLASDPDFQEMPEDVRRDLLQAFGGLDEDDLLREDGQHQIDAWRVKGFDVVPLERLLEIDPKGFREISGRLIRAQVMKKAEGGQYRCPLCDVRLESTAEECENCGARFA